MDDDMAEDTYPSVGEQLIGYREAASKSIRNASDRIGATEGLACGLADAPETLGVLATLAVAEASLAVAQATAWLASETAIMRAEASNADYVRNDWLRCLYDKG